MDIDPQVVTTVILASGGYPGDYKKGKEIRNLDIAELIAQSLKL